MFSVSPLKTQMLSLAKSRVRGPMYPRPFAGLLYLPKYLREWRAYVKQAGRGVSRFRDTYPCLADRLPPPFDPHYFYQGAWLARRLAEALPPLHVNIGSDIRTISLLSATVRTVFVDYRPLRAALPNLHSLTADISRLPFREGSISSLSCLHEIEHVGLGRYGDTLKRLGQFRRLKNCRGF